MPLLAMAARLRGTMALAVVFAVVLTSRAVATTASAECPPDQRATPLMTLFLNAPNVTFAAIGDSGLFNASMLLSSLPATTPAVLNDPANGVLGQNVFDTQKLLDDWASIPDNPSAGQFAHPSAAASKQCPSSGGGAAAATNPIKPGPANAMVVLNTVGNNATASNNATLVVDIIDVALHGSSVDFVLRPVGKHEPAPEGGCGGAGHGYHHFPGCGLQTVDDAARFTAAVQAATAAGASRGFTFFIKHAFGPHSAADEAGEAAGAHSAAEEAVVVVVVDVAESAAVEEASAEVIVIEETSTAVPEEPTPPEEPAPPTEPETLPPPPTPDTPPMPFPFAFADDPDVLAQVAEGNALAPAFQALDGTPLPPDAPPAPFIERLPGGSVPPGFEAAVTQGQEFMAANAPNSVPPPNEEAAIDRLRRAAADSSVPLPLRVAAASLLANAASSDGSWLWWQVRLAGPEVPPLFGLGAVTGINVAPLGGAMDGADGQPGRRRLLRRDGDTSNPYDVYDPYIAAIKIEIVQSAEDVEDSIGDSMTG